MRAARTIPDSRWPDRNCPGAFSAWPRDQLSLVIIGFAQRVDAAVSGACGYEGFVARRSAIKSRQWPLAGPDVESTT
jgi:hypothetical protein